MPETEQRQKLREHFLEAFVRSLITDSYDPEKDKELQKELQKEKLAEMTEELKKTKGMPTRNFTQEYSEETSSQKMPTLGHRITHSPQSSPREKHQFQKKFGLVEPRTHPSPGRIPMIPRRSPIPLPQQQYKPSPLKPGQKPETVNLGKLAGILVDPSVFSVECQGPHKNLLVNRGGSIQTSEVTLTDEEINTMMHNISEQTRIPISGGVFRTAIQDLVVTAVISDFVGTRFVIQKRSPFQRY